ncbi:hypothetical protein [Solicola sp. PLA-1-18]|uniref:hypothetical protein n=1 Tax=Solicola sp. PLA-1-18 TaxID=3380532 RepID=UPI003B7EA1A6
MTQTDTDAPVGAGSIFTTEPLAMRALAAELRHDSARTRRVLQDLTGLVLPALTAVGCEMSRRENLDVVLEFGHVSVGIEGKIAHEVTVGQLTREARTVDHLLVLVKSQDDVPAEALTVTTTVVTWHDLLSRLPESRISVADIEAVNDTKRIARRALAVLDLGQPPAGWTKDDQAGLGGYPSLTLSSPPLDDGRQLTVQVEAARSDVGKKYVANVGISVTAADFAAPSSNITDAPTWIGYARAIGAFLEGRLKGTAAAISTEPGRGGSELSDIKMSQARQHDLPLKYATGYTGSYLGVRTGRVEVEVLGDMVAVLIPAVVELDGRLRR